MIVILSSIGVELLLTSSQSNLNSCTLRTLDSDTLRQYSVGSYCIPLRTYATVPQSVSWAAVFGSRAYVAYGKYIQWCPAYLYGR